MARNPEHKSEKEKQLIQKLRQKEEQVELQKAELLEKQLELEQALDKYADLYEFAPNAYLTLDSKGKITETNQTCTEMFGMDKKSIIDIPFMYFLAHDEIQNFLSVLRKIRLLKVQFSGEFRILFNGRKPIYTHIIFTPVYNYNTRNLNIRISISDITEKKKIENALKKSEERFRTMAESSPVMIWMSDNNNNLTYANKTKLEFLDKSFDEIKGQKWLDLIYPDDRSHYIEVASKAVERKTGFSIEMRVRNRSGEYRWVLRNAAANILPDGTIIGFIGSELDITEKKNIHLLTEKSLKEKEILLKEIHHRVKNNLQIISSLLNLQLNYVNDESITEMLKSSQARIRSMALIHEKLYKSQNLGSINFAEYVKDLTNFLFRTYKKGSTNVRLYTDLPDINLDINLSISLGLILNELITNSLKHAFPDNRAGALNISLSENGKKLELVFSDNGVGMPEDFEIKKTNSLGLELVDTLINQHNGKLELNQNSRTEFRILLEKK